MQLRDINESKYTRDYVKEILDLAHEHKFLNYDLNCVCDSCCKLRVLFNYNRGQIVTDVEILSAEYSHEEQRTMYLKMKRHLDKKQNGRQ